MIDTGLFIGKLDILRHFIFNKIDGIECPPLPDQYRLLETDLTITKLNTHAELSSETIIVTDHAFDRAKERLSMNRRSFIRLAEQAFENGIKHAESSGNLNRFITSKYLLHKKANNIRIYGENIFFFSNNVLLTVYQVPTNLRKSAIKISKQKKAA